MSRLPTLSASGVSKPRGRASTSERSHVLLEDPREEICGHVEEKPLDLEDVGAQIVVVEVPVRDGI